jgi:hypothetical protein
MCVCVCVCVSICLLKSLTTFVVLDTIKSLGHFRVFISLLPLPSLFNISSIVFYRHLHSSCLSMKADVSFQEVHVLQHKGHM